VEGRVQGADLVGPPWPHDPIATWLFHQSAWTAAPLRSVNGDDQRRHGCGMVLAEGGPGNNWRIHCKRRGPWVERLRRRVSRSRVFVVVVPFDDRSAAIYR
jgi:hypothetical protein